MPISGRQDPELYRQMSLPFDSQDAANEAVNAFFNDVAELRKKHKLTNVYCVLHGTMLRDGDEGEFFVTSMFGDTIMAEALTAYAFGFEQAERQQRVAEIVTRSKALRLDRHRP